MEDFEIYCFLRKELAPEGQGHQTKLPPRITKSRVLQNLLDHFPGSRSSRNVRSERTLRDHVNNFILNNEVRLEEFDAEYKKRGTTGSVACVSLLAEVAPLSFALTWKLFSVVAGQQPVTIATKCSATSIATSMAT